MTVSFMEMHYSKVPPKTINYRDYKKFSNINFLNFFKEVFSTKAPNDKNGAIYFFISTWSKVFNKKTCTFYEQTYLERDYEEI